MKLLLASLLISFSTSALTKVIIKEELFVVGHGPEIIRDIIEAGTVEVDHVSQDGFEVYGPKGLSSYLDQKNILHFDMKSLKDFSLSDYPSHAMITAKLEALAAKYPHIMKLFSIGKSVRGQELWVMKISDNVEIDEVEPEFKYISSMHGDEITGRELSVSFIEEIGEKYGKDKEITSIVDNTEIFIMPSMNPDGSETKRRANARGVDLNRNFPEMTRDTESRPAGREVETQAVMAFQSSRQFALSANFHGGAVVANYPWDATYDAHPLEDLVKELSLGYAERNPEMRDSRSFPGGITNGAAWYVLKGGMQDWSYHWHNDLQITIELSHRKWPSYSEIPGFYERNKDSMVYFMKEVHRGAGFYFTRPNVEGTVSIRNTTRGENMGSFAFHGSEFYKVLPEGDYVFNVKEKGSSTVRLLRLRVEKDLIKRNGNYTRLN